MPPGATGQPSTRVGNVWEYGNRMGRGGRLACGNFPLSIVTGGGGERKSRRGTKCPTLARPSGHAKGGHPCLSLGTRVCLLLEAGAGDVLVLDFFGALDRVAGEVVGVPGDALGGHLRMLAQKLERVRGGSGIIFLVGELGRLDGGLVLLAQPAIENG